MSDFKFIRCEAGTTCSACGLTLWPHAGEVRMGLLVETRLKMQGWVRKRDPHGGPETDAKLVIGVHPTVCSVECIQNLGPEWREEGVNAS